MESSRPTNKYRLQICVGAANPGVTSIHHEATGAQKKFLILADGGMPVSDLRRTIEHQYQRLYANESIKYTVIKVQNKESYDLDDGFKVAEVFDQLDTVRVIGRTTIRHNKNGKDFADSAKSLTPSKRRLEDEPVGASTYPSPSSTPSALASLPDTYKQSTHMEVDPHRLKSAIQETRSASSTPGPEGEYDKKKAAKERKKKRKAEKAATKATEAVVASGLLAKIGSSGLSASVLTAGSEGQCGKDVTDEAAAVKQGATIAKKSKEAQERSRKEAEENASKEAEEKEKKRLAAEHVIALKEAEEKQRREAEEKRLTEAQEQKRKEAQDEKKRVEEEAKKQKAEEQTQKAAEKKKAAEEKKLKAAEAKEAKRVAAEEKARKAAEEAEAKKKAVEEKKRKVAEEKQLAAEEKAAKMAEQKAAKEAEAKKRNEAEESEAKAQRKAKENEKSSAKAAEHIDQSSSPTPELTPSGLTREEHPLEQKSLHKSLESPTKVSKPESAGKAVKMLKETKEAKEANDAVQTEAAAPTALEARTSETLPSGSIPEVPIASLKDDIVEEMKFTATPATEQAKVTSKLTTTVEELPTPPALPKKRGRPPKMKPESIATPDPAGTAIATIVSEPAPLASTKDEAVVSPVNPVIVPNPESPAVNAVVNDDSGRSSSIGTAMEQELEVLQFLQERQLKRQQLPPTPVAYKHSTTIMTAEQYPGTPPHPYVVNSPAPRFTDKPSMDSDSDEDEDEESGPEASETPTMPPMIMSSRPSISVTRARTGSPRGLAISMPTRIKQASPDEAEDMFDSGALTEEDEEPLVRSRKVVVPGVPKPMTLIKEDITAAKDDDGDEKYELDESSEESSESGHQGSSDDDSTSSDSDSQSESESESESEAASESGSGLVVKETIASGSNILDGLLSLQGASTGAKARIGIDSNVQKLASTQSQPTSFISLSDISAKMGLSNVMSLSALTAQARARKMETIGSAIVSPASSSPSSSGRNGRSNGKTVESSDESSDSDDGETDSDEVDSSDDDSDSATKKKAGPQVKIAGKKRKSKTSTSGVNGSIRKKKRGPLGSLF
ncbi:hypothetical protein BGX28_003835 [Mortierella sp. GBA30]|nr:hypothetical protein BGX28_003835 [Mortierella sp. GBA30]